MVSNAGPHQVAAFMIKTFITITEPLFKRASFINGGARNSI